MGGPFILAGALTIGLSLGNWLWHGPQRSPRRAVVPTVREYAPDEEYERPGSDPDLEPDGLRATLAPTLVSRPGTTPMPGLVFASVW